MRNYNLQHSQKQHSALQQTLQPTVPASVLRADWLFLLRCAVVRALARRNGRRFGRRPRSGTDDLGHSGAGGRGLAVRNLQDHFQGRRVRGVWLLRRRCPLVTLPLREL